MLTDRSYYFTTTTLTTTGFPLELLYSYALQESFLNKIIIQMYLIIVYGNLIIARACN